MSANSRHEGSNPSVSARFGRYRWVGRQLASKARGDRKVRGSTPLSSASYGSVAQLGRAADLYPVEPDKLLVAGSSPATTTIYVILY